MKLLYCKKCHDIILLRKGVRRVCECRKTRGIYIDDLNAEYDGEHAVPLGFDNKSFLQAIKDQPSEGMGQRFEAFVIPKSCPTFVRSEARE